MKKTNLKISEIYSLFNEINGITDAEGKLLQRGLIEESITLVMKYWIRDLSINLKDIIKTVEESRNDIIKKYSQDKENPSIKPVGEDGKPTEEYKLFYQDFLEILNQEREVEHFDFKLSSFSSLTTSNVYDVFFKLVNPE